MSDENQTPSDVQGTVTSINAEKVFSRTDIQARLGDAFVPFAAAVQAATLDITMNEEHARRTFRAMVHLCARFAHETLGVKLEAIGGQAGEAGSHEASAIWKKLNPEAQKAHLTSIDGGLDEDGEEDGEDEQEESDPE